MPARLTHQPPAASPHSSRQLHRAVRGRALVERAKGAVILHFRIDADEAFELLRRWARETGSTVPVVAETLVHAVCLGDDTRDWDQAVLDHLREALETPGPPAVPRPREGGSSDRAGRLDVRIRYAPSLPVVRLRGALDASSVDLVLDAVRSVSVASCPACLVVLDLGGVTACDVEALAALETAAEMLGEVGKELLLHSAPDEVETLIISSGRAAGLERR